MPYKKLDERKKYQRVWYEKNKLLTIKRSKEWSSKNKDKTKISKTKWRKNNIEASRNAILKWKKNNSIHVKEYNKKWWSLNSKKRDKNYYKEYYKKNAERLRTQQQERRKLNPQKYRDIAKKSFNKIGGRYKKYGLSIKEFEKMVKEQNNLCKICKEQKKLFIDHCHKSGKVRGLLCRSCNLGIGFLNDNPTIINNAHKYVTRTTKTS